MTKDAATSARSGRRKRRRHVRRSSKRSPNSSPNPTAAPCRRARPPSVLASRCAPCICTSQPGRPDRRHRGVVRSSLLPERRAARLRTDDLARYFHEHPREAMKSLTRALATAPSPGGNRSATADAPPGERHPTSRGSDWHAKRAPRTSRRCCQPVRRRRRLAAARLLRTPPPTDLPDVIANTVQLIVDQLHAQAAQRPTARHSMARTPKPAAATVACDARHDHDDEPKRGR